MTDNDRKLLADFARKAPKSERILSGSAEYINPIYKKFPSKKASKTATVKPVQKKASFWDRKLF